MCNNTLLRPIVESETTSINIRDHLKSSLEDMTQACISRLRSEQEQAAEIELRRIKELSRQRYLRYVKRKKKEGWNKINLWIKLEKGDLDFVASWLKKQKPEQLIKLAEANVSLEALLSEYSDRVKDEKKGVFLNK